MLLKDRNVVISGVGPGLGIELARAAVREGARVVLAARSAAFLEKAAAELRARGGFAVCAPTDITDSAQCQRLAEIAGRELGPVHGLVNNAYLYGQSSLFENTTAEMLRVPYEVNLVGTLQLTRALLPALRAARVAAVVNVGSISSRRPRPELISYAASKGALLAATRSLALELGPCGIRVNSVPVGWMWGPAVEESVPRMAEKYGLSQQAYLRQAAGRMPLGRIVDDAECADAVIFMVSPLACAVTGAILDVNGGEWME